MDYFKFGLSNLFGIIAPGLIMLCGLYLGTVCSFEYFKPEAYGMVNRYFPVLSDIYNNPSLIIFFTLILSFFLGAAIRLFATDVVERLSGFFLRALIFLRISPKKSERPKHKLWAKSKFPCEYVSKWIKEDMGTVGEKAIDRLRSLNQTFDKEGSSLFYNYCKMYVKAKSAERSLHCEQMEAYVRFLAGSFVSGATTFIICILYGILFLMQYLSKSTCLECHQKSSFFVMILSGVAFVMLVVIVAILFRFRNQRGKEIMHTWLAFYDCYPWPATGAQAKEPGAIQLPDSPGGSL